MLCGAFAFAIMSELAYALGPKVDWQLVAIARTGIAMLCAAALAVASGAKLVFFRPRILWMRSIAGSVSLVCGFYALTHLPVADVLTMTNMFPLWVAVLSWPLLGEPPPMLVWPASVCGIVGVVLIQQPHVAGGNFAALVALFSSFTSAIALIGLHRLQGIDSRAIVAHFSAVSLLFTLGALLIFDHSPNPWAAIDFEVAAMMLGVGVSATVGQILLTKAFSSAHPAKVSVVALSQVGFGILLDVILWQRQFDGLMIAGILLILLPTAGVLLAREARQEAQEHVGP